MKRHCWHLTRNGALRIPCKGIAERLWIRDDGVLVGLCHPHRSELDLEARLRHWTEHHELVEAVAA